MSDLQAQIKIEVLNVFSGPLRKFGLELKDVDGALGKVGEKGRKAGAELATGLNQAAEAMGRIRDFTKDLLKGPIDQFADFDAALAKVSAKTGELKGSSGFEALKTQAEDLGAATKYSAEQVALAQAEFAASGRDTQEILQAIPSTLSLATAATIDLARATEITNEVLNQFQLTAQDTVHVQDVLAHADEVSAASVEGLGEALSYVGTTANRLKIPLETTSALLAALANAGQKGSTGGTNLTAFLSALVAPSKMAKASLHDLGLSLAQIKELQTQVATGHIDTAIKKMAELNSKLDPRKSAEVLDKIFGERGGRAASVLFRAMLDTSDKGLGALIENFNGEEVNGAVNRTAKIMESSFAGALERASGAVSGLATTFGETLSPTVEKIAKHLENAAGYLQAFIKKHPEAAETLGELLLVAAAVTSVAVPLLTVAASVAGFAALLGTKGAVGGALVALTGPLGLLAIALGAVATGLYVFRHEISDWISEMLGRKKGGADGTTSDAANKGIQDFRGGWSLRSDGTIFQMGDIKDAPKSVQEAMLRTGSRNQDVLNEYLARRSAAVPVMLRGVPGAKPYQPDGEPTGLPYGQGALLPSTSATPFDPSDTEAAIREQTVFQARDSAQQNDFLKQILDEMKRKNRQVNFGSTPVAP